jgi:hypothetical protein
MMRERLIGASEAWRTPASWSSGRSGTLMVRTVPVGSGTIQVRASAATVAAVPQQEGSSESMLTATAEIPWPAAVSAAATVPEWKIGTPMLWPRLIPDTTTSGARPNAPTEASVTARAGVPSMPV